MRIVHQVGRGSKRRGWSLKGFKYMYFFFERSLSVIQCVPVNGKRLRPGIARDGPAAVIVGDAGLDRILNN